LIAIGGDADEGSNSAIGLMAAIGSCVSKPSPIVVIELSTIAGEWALTQFSDSTDR
jgi:hypothetical protein